MSQYAFGDLDRDGFTDFAFANESVRIAWGPDFRATSLLADRHPAYGVSSFDIDADGDLDLLTDRNDVGYPFDLWIGSGERTFERHELTSGGLGPLCLIDFDGDAFPEILSGTRDEVRIHRILRQGDSWSSDEVAAIESVVESWSVRCVDLDIDGVDELVYADPSARQVAVHFGRRVGGLLDFSRPPVITTLPGPVGRPVSQIADSDLNGLPELWFNEWFIESREPGRLRSSLFVTEHQRRTDAVAWDLDGDGYDELIRGRGGLEILPGGRSGFRSPISVASFGGGETAAWTTRLYVDARSADDVRIVTNDVHSMAIVHFNGRSFEPVQIDRIDLPSPFVDRIAVTSWNGESEPRFLIPIRVDPETYELAVQRLEAGVLVTEFRFPVPFRTDRAIGADIDGDGWTDVVVGEPNGAQVAFGSPDGPVFFSEAVDTTSDVAHIVSSTVVDVDADGVSEVLVAIEGTVDRRDYCRTDLLRRDRSGSWSATRLTDSCAGRVDAGDLDGDGRSDALVWTRDGLELYSGSSRVVAASS